MKFFLQLCCVVALLCPAALARRCAQAPPSVAANAGSQDQVIACPRVWPPRGTRAPAGGDAGTSRELAYSFDLSPAAETPGRLHITLDLKVPASGSEVIALPSEWAETTRLERGIEHLAVTGGHARLLPGLTPALRELHAAPGERAQLSYDLVSDRGLLAAAAERHRVLLRPGLIEFNGSNGLVAPAIDPSARVHVTLRFTGLPAAQTVVTSFGVGATQEMTGTWREMRGALFAGGDLRTQELVVEGAPVLLAIAPPRSGEWRFTDEEAAGKVRRILAAERMFWRDLDIPWYAVVIAPLGNAGVAAADEPAGVGGGGTAFTHAFLLSLAPREGFGAETESLFAHEAFHEWNPVGMGSVGTTPAPAWFTEGVTTFYQDRLLERARLLDADEYLLRVNRIVRDDRFLRDGRSLREDRAAAQARVAHGQQPSAQAQVATGPQISAARLDAEETTYRAPYLRGALIAMWLDAEIRQQTHGARSLDDLMLALRADREQPLTEERVLHTAAYLVDPPTVEQLRRLAKTDATVPVEASGLTASLGRCVDVRERALWSFDLGLNPAELRHGAVLAGVRPESAAWRAGLRDGQTLDGWEMVTGDADHEVVMMVETPAGRREVHYLPRGEEVRVPQLQLVPGCVGAEKSFRQNTIGRTSDVP